ncbi:hypothetical protein BV898_18035 [Hypsibius exemplaris]|uniref:Uncharacterized protein n=1 Tax=Hypsibius exemplaris TaxID=2072580 RepID=A0A9X6RMQ4_HYPEX|nr:hypothetical protein BV898_18035 [Hypsibius exemplaris]
MLISYVVARRMPGHLSLECHPDTSMRLSQLRALNPPGGPALLLLIPTLWIVASELGITVVTTMAMDGDYGEWNTQTGARTQRRIHRLLHSNASSRTMLVILDDRCRT